jgi:3-dehydroquinate dehydratase/shikimate dehydrogenase
MIFLVLQEKKIPEKIPSWIDGFEIRFDLIPEDPLEAALFFKHNSPLPLLFTCKTSIPELLALKPEYYDFPLAPHSVASYHNFDQTPLDLDAIYASMEDFNPFAIKIAAFANTALDAFRLFAIQPKKPHAIIAMGEKGEWTRVLNKTVPHRINYTCLPNAKTPAPGQIDIETLEHLYRYPHINQETDIYALIGSPITHSQSPAYHNQVFQNLGKNAVYVKIPLEPQELKPFFAFAKTIRLKGASVTMPLKKEVLPFIDILDDDAKHIGAVNTLRFENGLVFGTNTDGKGAAAVMEKRNSLQGQTIVILGTGATAQAIAFETQKKGAEPILVDRVAMQQNQIPKNYDWIINATPHPMPISPGHFLPNTWAMDTAYHPTETPFLQAAKAQGASTLNGQEMFENQASLQTSFWKNEPNSFTIN